MCWKHNNFAIVYTKSPFVSLATVIYMYMLNLVQSLSRGAGLQVFYQSFG